MKILVTGATGFVGRQLVKQLVLSGKHQPVAASRRRDADFPAGVKTVTCDNLGANASWREALEGVDVVIHSAARVHIMNDQAASPLEEFRKANRDGTLSLAQQAVEAGVKRFIFVSSIKVNGEETLPGKPFTADDIHPPSDPYGLSKYEAELELQKLAQKSGLEVVIVRPVLVYGPGVKANFLSMMKWLNKGVPLPLGAVCKNRRSLVALDNLVDLLITCVDHPNAANQSFLVSDDHDLSTTDLLKHLGKALHHPARLLPVPSALLNLAAGLIGKKEMMRRLTGSLQVDISKTKQTLGWKPPLTVEQALKDTANDFLGQENH